MSQCCDFISTNLLGLSVIRSLKGIYYVYQIFNGNLQVSYLSADSVDILNILYHRHINENKTILGFLTLMQSVTN